MTTEEPIELEIEILAKDATEDELDKMTRTLLKTLREQPDVQAKMVSTGSAPEGSKGDALSTLTVTVLPIVLPGLVDVIKSWATLRQGRTVKFKGKGIEFEGSSEDLDRLLERLEREKKKK